MIQLVLAEGGINLDELLIEPITSRQTGINVFGAVGGTQEVFRPNALTGDPNHLGIELVDPAARAHAAVPPARGGTPAEDAARGRARRSCSSSSWRRSRAARCSASAAACSCSRCRTASHLRRPAFLSRSAPSGSSRRGRSSSRLDFFLTVLRARTNTSRASASPHFEVYSFIPDVLSTNPFLGLGLNNFAVYYEFVTGRPDFGPHSFYVATLVETGLVGATLFAVFVVWLFRRLGAARRIGRALVGGRRPARRTRAAAWRGV